MSRIRVTILHTINGRRQKERKKEKDIKKRSIQEFSFATSKVEQKQKKRTILKKKRKAVKMNSRSFFVIDEESE